MKIFPTLFMILSITYGLNAFSSARYAKPGESCPDRIFADPGPRQIHYIYHGETCDCPKFHDVVVEKPVDRVKTGTQVHEYGIQMQPNKMEEKVNRYIFDVRVETPVDKARDRPQSFNYQIVAPVKPAEKEPVRYIFDSRVEEPIKPCKEKPWQGLVAQVDRVLMPARDCNNPHHTPQTCNCGCRDPSHTPQTCTCGSNDYTLPIVYNYNHEESSIKVKRDAKSSLRDKLKIHDRNRKTPKMGPLKALTSKGLKLWEENLKPKLKSKTKSRSLMRHPRRKRGNGSPCGYSYHSCDPKKHNKDGCPLCYRCNCEPIDKQEAGQKFSPYDFKVPYKLVKHDESPGTAPTFQEFDDEQPSYTGLKDPEMYKKYIQQLVSKYPEHMSRTMPDLKDQQQDLLKFISELAESDSSPGDVMEGEDVRYKLVDNAMDMYKYYEKAVSKLPKLTPGDGKLFKKRGSVLEVIELDPNDLKGNYKIIN
ncbi:CLUMA_CG010917, isoform A [Clunio marinus]|uniref:CLUMA_CG010917, isoform A n=1 Tax=Clunio marinus TaxID=568069 RepID=A0A1J1IBC0_9DIPT|nr:CLUMA_CG010917, isoform A [Clunio marinus]